MSVAMIAVSRCLTLTKPELGQKLFSGFYGKLVIVLIWIYANILMVPMYMPSLELESFGYNCRVGKCDFIPSKNGHNGLQVYLYAIGFSVPCIMTSLSYIMICWYVRSTNKYLKEVGHGNIRKIITKREIRTTWTLFMICFCYFLFVMPMALVNMIDVEGEYPHVHLALFCLYWLQYSLNFFVYAARSEQYRKAYSYFLNRVKKNFIFKIFCHIQIFY